jgi:hypothetical protein
LMGRQMRALAICSFRAKKCVRGFRSSAERDNGMNCGIALHVSMLTSSRNHPESVGRRGIAVKMQIGAGQIAQSFVGPAERSLQSTFWRSARRERLFRLTLGSTHMSRCKATRSPEPHGAD